VYGFGLLPCQTSIPATSLKSGYWGVFPAFWCGVLACFIVSNLIFLLHLNPLLITAGRPKEADKPGARPFKTLPPDPGSQGEYQQRQLPREGLPGEQERGLPGTELPREYPPASLDHPYPTPNSHGMVCSRGRPRAQLWSVLLAPRHPIRITFGG
jgi:hypothetical protein